MRDRGPMLRLAAAFAVASSFACSSATIDPSSHAEAGKSSGAGSSSGGVSMDSGGMGTGDTGAGPAGGVNASGDAGANGDLAGRGGAAVGGGAGDANSAGANGGLAGTPSTGCISQQVPASGHFTIDVAGTEREYILKLPASYDVTKPTAYPLFVLLHGRMFSAQTVVDGMQPSMTGPYYGLEAASGGRAILVAAQALSTSWTNENGRDVAYLNAMIARFKTSLCFDQNRVFGVGFSMGAIMTLTAGCDAGNGFRAIAPMSASLPSNCSGAGKPLAYWGSHGTSDPTINISQGEAVRDSFVKRNGCKSTTTPGDRAGCESYDGCAAGAPVVWCTFDGVHEPPTFAGDAIWKFMSEL
jgi:poly(3-hydroxybutyrate) depolymerase